MMTEAPWRAAAVSSYALRTVCWTIAMDGGGGGGDGCWVMGDDIGRV